MTRHRRPVPPPSRGIRRGPMCTYIDLVATDTIPSNESEVLKEILQLLVDDHASVHVEVNSSNVDVFLAQADLASFIENASFARAIMTVARGVTRLGSAAVNFQPSEGR